VCLCLYDCDLDSSSEDESVCEPAPSNTDQQAEPTPTVTVSAYDADSAAVSATEAVDVTSPLDEQLVADVAVVYENVTAQSAVDEQPQQSQQQQQQERDDIDEHQSDVDVLPTSRPQCTASFALCLSSCHVLKSGFHYPS